LSHPYPSPEEQAFNFTPRDGVYLETSNGMMEWWNNGILGLKNGIYPDLGIRLK
jgi:hypothetical protein